MNNPQETYTKAEVDALIAEARKPRYRWPDTFTTMLTSICLAAAWLVWWVGTYAGAGASAGLLMLLPLVMAWHVFVGYVTFGRHGNFDT